MKESWEGESGMFTIREGDGLYGAGDGASEREGGMRVPAGEGSVLPAGGKGSVRSVRSRLEGAATLVHP